MICKGSSHAYKLNRTSRFTDDICTINDDGEFSSSYKCVYPKQLEQNLEHQEEYTTFSELDITIEGMIFVYKFLDKRNKFPFFIVRMPYLLSNIPSSIFYGSIFSEFLRTARGTRCLVSKTSQLYARMVTNAKNKESIPR